MSKIEKIVFPALPAVDPANPGLAVAKQIFSASVGGAAVVPPTPYDPGVTTAPDFEVDPGPSGVKVDLGMAWQLADGRTTASTVNTLDVPAPPPPPGPLPTPGQVTATVATADAAPAAPDAPPADAPAPAAPATDPAATAPAPAADASATATAPAAPAAQ